MDRTTLTKTFIALMAVTGAASAVFTGVASHTLHLNYALALLAIAGATSRMKVKLPGVDGNMSVNLPFLLMAVISLSATEAIVIACVSTVVQCWPKRGGEFKAQQVVFNVSMMAFATSVANLIWNSGWFAKATWPSEPLMLALTTAAFFFGQTAPVATVINFAEGASLHRTWLNIAQLSFPYFVLSAGVTSMMTAVSHRFGWQAALVMFPVMYGVHHSYRMYFGKVLQTFNSPAMARAARSGV